MSSVTTITPAVRRQIVELLAEGAPRQTVARELGVTYGQVSRVAQGGHLAKPPRAVQQREALGERRKGGGYLPTPDEIEAACLSIRETRDEPEAEPWTVPVCCEPVEY